MPNKTVYIRKRDLDKWESLTNKADKISKLLNGFVDKTDVIAVSAFDTVIDNTPRVAMGEMPRLVMDRGDLPFTRPEVKQCPHGAAVGFCKKGCKK